MHWLFVATLVVASALCAVAWHGAIGPFVARQRLPRRLLVHAAWPLVLAGLVFIVRFWHPTAGPFEANVKYPFGSHLNAWAVSFGFMWMAFGVLYAALCVHVPDEPTTAVLTVLAATWAVAWLPHGVIGLAVALEGMTSRSVSHYATWASHPVGVLTLVADAVLLVLHFSFAGVGLTLEAVSVRRHRVGNGGRSTGADP